MHNFQKLCFCENFGGYPGDDLQLPCWFGSWEEEGDGNIPVVGQIIQQETREDIW